VFGGITKIIGNKVEFEDGKEGSFDAIVFATGYKSTVNLWLKVQKGPVSIFSPAFHVS
jgi:indole-3-pyruvate monooxygenase